MKIDRLLVDSGYKPGVVAAVKRRIGGSAMMLCKGIGIFMGLLPIVWSSGTGSDVMKRIAAPMVGGIVTSFLLELLIYPVIYVFWKGWGEMRALRHGEKAAGN